MQVDIVNENPDLVKTAFYKKKLLTPSKMIKYFVNFQLAQIISKFKKF